MPGGIPRADLVPLYAYHIGVTEKKADEHLELLIQVKQLIEDDLRIYLYEREKEQVTP